MGWKIGCDVRPLILEWGLYCPETCLQSLQLPGKFYWGNREWMYVFRFETCTGCKCHVRSLANEVNCSALTLDDCLITWDMHISHTLQFLHCCEAFFLFFFIVKLSRTTRLISAMVGNSTVVKPDGNDIKKFHFRNVTMIFIRTTLHTSANAMVGNPIAVEGSGRILSMLAVQQHASRWWWWQWWWWWWQRWWWWWS